MEDKFTDTSQTDIEDKFANSSAIPDWLKDTQNRSWEPEVIISGLILTSLFIVPTKLFQFYTILIQEYAVSFVSSLVIFLYLSFVINVFKVFFIIHLLSRLAWAGLVGLSYAFPEGVDNTKLFKTFSEYKFRSPTELVIKLENWCSTLFGFPVYTGILFTVFTFVLFLLVGVSILFGLHSTEEIYLFLLLTAIYTVIAYVFKKSKIAQWIGTSIPSTISSIYQSNLGKWKVMIFVYCIMFLSMPNILSDLHGFDMYANISNIDDELEWLNKSFWYEEYHDEELRYARAFIKKEQVYNESLLLNIVHYQEDEFSIASLKSGEFQIPDSIDWEIPQNFPDLFRVYLNDSLVSNLDWAKVKLKIDHQKAFTMILDIEHLKPGKNLIRVEKLCAFSILMSDKIKVRKRWAEIPFYKMKK
ncbi:MAG: hypothetical protein CMO01_23155 [Thalassobius sp.]|nr:hypothetical protein [Thalassovita sp.]